MVSGVDKCSYFLNVYLDKSVTYWKVRFRCRIIWVSGSSFSKWWTGIRTVIVIITFIFTPSITIRNTFFCAGKGCKENKYRGMWNEFACGFVINNIKYINLEYLVLFKYSITLLSNSFSDLNFILTLKSSKMIFPW